MNELQLPEPLGSASQQHAANQGRLRTKSPNFETDATGNFHACLAALLALANQVGNFFRKPR